MSNFNPNNGFGPNGNFNTPGYPSNPYSTPSSFQPNQTPPSSNTPNEDNLAIVGFVLGWCLPCIGIFTSIAGIVVSSLGLKSKKHKSLAMLGLVLSIFGLIFTIANAVIGVYLQILAQNGNL